LLLFNTLPQPSSLTLTITSLFINKPKKIFLSTFSLFQGGLNYLILQFLILKDMPVFVPIILKIRGGEGVLRFHLLLYLIQELHNKK
jgi:hypothetical protein